MRIKNCSKGWACTLILALAFTSATAQRVAVKTNALYWATLSPNLGAEFRLSRHFTLNIEATANPFTVSSYKLTNASIAPEVRYWLSGRPQAGHFFGGMALLAVYDMKWDDTYHKGDAVGLGVTYGYSFVLSRRWSLETTIGLGALRYREKKYTDAETAPSDANHKSTIIAPLKAGVTFTYILK